MQDIYKVMYRSQIVGFFHASTWGDASKKGASHYKSETGNSDYWGHFMSTWVNPKHYEREGVPIEMYQNQVES